MGHATRLARAWLDARYQRRDEHGVFVAHQPVYGLDGPWEEAEPCWRLARIVVLLRLLDGLRFRRVLDVGGGDGFLAHLLRRVFAAGGVLGIFAEGKVGFRETELLPFEDGAVAFAAASGVPIVPCVIVGSTFMWFRRRVVFRYGEPIPTDDVHGREARQALDERVRAAMWALLPDREPRLPRRRPLRFLGDLLTGPADLERRRMELGE